MKNRKGFTLIELLATLVVIALVAGITTTIALNVINKAKSKSKDITLKNVTNQAEKYIYEGLSDKSKFWATEEESGTEYQCVKVQDLVDAGYFKQSIIDENSDILSKDSYIKVVRNANTKAITSKTFVGDATSLTCQSVLNKVNIQCLFEEGWSQSKNVTIKYDNLNSFPSAKNKVNLNSIDYGDITPACTEDNHTNCTAIGTNNFQFNLKNLSEPKVTVEALSNGMILASSEDNSGLLGSVACNVTGIDNEPPEVSLAIEESEENESVLVCDLSDSESGIQAYKICKTEECENSEWQTLDPAVNNTTKSLVANTPGDWECYGADSVGNISSDTQTVEEEVPQPIGGKIVTLTYHCGDDITCSNLPSQQSCEILAGSTRCTINISNTIPTRSGYTFRYWKSKASGNEDKHWCGNENTSSECNRTDISISMNNNLHAVWEKNSGNNPTPSSSGTTTYTLKYNCGSGVTCSNLPSNNSGSSNVKNISDTIPTRSGYTFRYWKTSGGTTTYCGEDEKCDKHKITMSSSTVTLYAQWKSSGGSSGTTYHKQYCNNTYKEKCRIYLDDHVYDVPNADGCHYTNSGSVSYSFRISLTDIHNKKKRCEDKTPTSPNTGDAPYTRGLKEIRKQIICPASQQYIVNHYMPKPQYMDFDHVYYYCSSWKSVSNEKCGSGDKKDGSTNKPSSGQWYKCVKK